MSRRGESRPVEAVSDTVPAVLLVAPQPFFRPSGTPLNVLQMCRALADSGHAVHLASFPHGEDVGIRGLHHHRAMALPGVGAAPIGFSWQKVVYDLMLAATVARLLLSRRFVAVHALEEAAFFAVPLARLCGVPAVVDLDSDLPDLLRSHKSTTVRRLAPWAERWRRWTLHRAACAVTVAPCLSELVRQESPGTPVFEIADTPLEGALRLPEPARVAALAQRLNLPAGRKWIVYTGNLDARQGVAELVAALPLLQDAAAALLIIGGEPDGIAALQHQAAALGVAERLVCAGRLPPEQMPEAMALADVLVSPRLEAQVTPLKIFSYMASGRAIVATDLPTHRVVLDDTCAELAAPTPHGLAAGIARLLAEPPRAAALGQAARRRVLREHSPERFRRQMAELYRFIATTSGRTGDVRTRWSV